MTFGMVAAKLQDELIEIIESGKELNDYELIVYKYVFISELKIPLWEDLGFEMSDNSFILYIIPDGLKFSLLRDLVEAFDRFDVTFMSNPYNLIKLRFNLNVQR